MSKKEQQQIQACLNGNRKAQSFFYDTYSPKLYPICLRYTENTADAEAILLEGFLKIFQHLHQFEGKGSLLNWMKKVMVNTALMHIRKRKALNFALLEFGKAEIAIAPEVLDQLAVEDLLAVIQKLPFGFRTIFNLYAIEGFSHKEIASELNISENTSRSQYARAKKALRRHLRKLQSELEFQINNT